MNRDIALDLFRLSGRQVEDLVGSIPDERMADQPGCAVNHPAWTVAHLCVAMDFALMLLGSKAGGGVSPEGWMELAKPGTVPTAERGRYPGKDELLSVFRRGHEALDAAVRGADDAAFTQAMPIEAFREVFPTAGHGVAYFLMSHEPAHLGQLGDWRRGAGVS